MLSEDEEEDEEGRQSLNGQHENLQEADRPHKGNNDPKVSGDVCLKEQK